MTLIFETEMCLTMGDSLIECMFLHQLAKKIQEEKSMSQML